MFSRIYGGHHGGLLSEDYTSGGDPHMEVLA